MRPVLPADPSSFLRSPNKGHIGTRTCLLPATPEEVACAPEPPVCIVHNKAPWHQILCMPPLCSVPFDGLTPHSQFFSNPFSLLLSWVAIIDTIRRYIGLKLFIIFSNSLFVNRLTMLKYPIKILKSMQNMCFGFRIF